MQCAAVCCIVRCVSVCCSVMQCVAVCVECQCVAVCCSVMQCIAACVVLQCVAVCCSVMQCVAVSCSVSVLDHKDNEQKNLKAKISRHFVSEDQHTDTQHTLLQHPASHCSTLQLTNTQCWNVSAFCLRGPKIKQIFGPHICDTKCRDIPALRVSVLQCAAA